MVQEIGTAIVMFLLGSVLTYFSTRWSKTLAKIDCLEFGVQSILRDRMTQMHRYYRDTLIKIKNNILFLLFFTGQTATCRDFVKLRRTS